MKKKEREEGKNRKKKKKEGIVKNVLNRKIILNKHIEIFIEMLTHFRLN